MERLDFSTLWQNERWSDVTLVIKPRGSQEEPIRNAGGDAGPSSSAPDAARAGRRMTRSMAKSGPATPGRQQAKTGTPLSTSPATQPAQQRGAVERNDSPGSGTVKASRGTRNTPAATGKSSRAAPSAALSPNATADEPATPSAAAAKAAALSNLPLGSVIYPAHAAVLISTSEYFRRYFESWLPDDGSKVVAIEVEPDEVEAAKLMLRYMYTGQLPSEGVDPSQLLRMIKLADQFSVNRFLATCNSALADIPLESLSLDHVASILALPPFLLEGEGGALAVARRRAEAKLAATFGDLEGAWFEPARRQEFLRLPLPAVRFLMRRTETAVYNENTALVALTDWIVANGNNDNAAGANNAGPGGAAAAAAGGSSGEDDGAATAGVGSADAGPGTTASETAAAAEGPTAVGLLRGGGGSSILSEAQLDELFGLIRLPHLSAAFMSLLPHIGWVARRLTPQLLARVLQLVKAEAGLAGGAGAAGGAGGGGGGPRGVGSDGRPLGWLYGNGALELLQRLTGPAAVARAVPERMALELEWTIHRSDVQALIAECRAEDCSAAVCRGGGGGSGGSGSGAGGCGSGCEEGCGAATVESTRLFSEPAYYYAGFYWRMCFFVQKKVEPKRRRLGDMHDVSGGGGGGGAGGAAAAAGGAGGAIGGGGLGANQAADAQAGDAGGRIGGGGGVRDVGGGAGHEAAVYHDFLGVTCRAVLGGEEFAPLTCMNLELMGARFNALGEQLPAQRAEVPGYVDDEVPYGVYDFFRQDNLSDASQLAPFVCRRNMLHLSCRITMCS